MANDPILRCPTCLTKVTEVDLGMRDFRWVSPKLPGRVAPMDVDFMLEKNGHFLVLEFKPKQGALGMGARITYRALVRLGMDVWVVWQDNDHMVVVGTMDKRGEIIAPVLMTEDELAERVAAWFESHTAQKEDG